MRRARLMGGGRVEVVEAPEPRPGEGQVLLEVKSSLLCGSELHAWRAEQAHESNVGHEVAGVVLDAGGSRRWRAGDRVGVHAVWGCGQCSWCHQGIYTFCADRTGISGGHAERLAVPDHVLVPLPDEVSFELGALLAGDGLGVPYHTGQRLPTRGGDTVVIIGCGPIGLGSVLLHAFRGARVIGLDVQPLRLAMARDLGADLTFDVTAVDPVEAVRQATSGRLADAVIEATGRPEGFNLAFRLVGCGGAVACCGENRDVTLNVGRDLIRRDITCFGSWFCHFREIPEMLELYRRGLPLEKLVTHRWPLAEADTAFTEFAAGRTGKVSLEP